MQDQHSISFTADIMRKIPANLRTQVRAFNVVLTGEVTEKGGSSSGISVKTKGRLIVSGEATSVHYVDKILAAVRESSGGRIVQNQMTTKKS